MEKLYPKSKGPETGSPFFGKRTASISGAVVSHHSHELPSLDSLRDNSVKIGHLKKLCGRGILSPGTWKDRYGLLQQNQLYLYENQDAEGKEKGIGVVIDLSHYDTVTEAPTRVTRKAANVFFLGTSDKRFFDSSGRHYFATESESEMKGWVCALQSSIQTGRNANGASNKRSEETDGVEAGESTRRKNKKNASTASPASLKTLPEPKMRSSIAIPKNIDDDKPEIILGGTLPRSGGQLDCAVAKGRAKGPPGRRLPRSAPNKTPTQPHLLPSSMEALEGSGPPSGQFRDGRGRATSLSALEHNNYGGGEESRGASNRSSSTSRKDRSVRKPGLEFDESAEFWKQNGRRSWEAEDKKTEGISGGSQSSFALAYHYSSSEEDGEAGPEPDENNAGTDTSALSRTPYETSRAVSGPQVKVSTPKSLRLSRRTLNTATGGVRGGTPVRHSASMTPPPCLLRKLRREMSIERSRDAELELDDMGSFPDDLNGPCWRRTSSGSSLSTITPDASPYEEEQKLRNNNVPNHGGNQNGGHVHLPQFPRHLTYASLQRPIGTGHSNGTASNSNIHKKVSKNMLSSPTMSPRHGNYFRGSASATASPIINGRYNNNNNGHYSNGHLQQQWFQHPLERSMETVKKELGSVGQETRRLDMDMNCVRQDVESVQESLVQIRASLESTRERAGRLALLIGNAERQVATTLKETGVLRKEALKLLESAQASKGLHEQLAEEAEGLLVFLRQLVASCHQPNSACPCCNTLEGKPALPCMPLHNGMGFMHAGSPFRSTKTPDRVLDSIPESKTKSASVSSSGFPADTGNCSDKTQRRRQDSIESDITSSDNESSSIVGLVQKSDYHKS